MDIYDGDGLLDRQKVIAVLDEVIAPYAPYGMADEDRKRLIDLTDELADGFPGAGGNDERP